MSGDADRDVLTLLGQKYSLAILQATAEPKTSQELSDDLDIPIATCYRRVRDLASVGLLEEADPGRTSGRSGVRYVRTTQNVRITFSESLSVHQDEARSATHALARIWQRLVSR